MTAQGSDFRLTRDVGSIVFRVGLLGDLVHTSRVRKTRAHIQELLHPGAQAVTDCAVQEVPICPGDPRDIRNGGDSLLRQPPIRREVV